MSDLVLLILYGIPLLIIFLFYFIRNRKVHKKSESVLTENVEAGLTEPASLHPLINEADCIGCAACIRACPEKTVIGLINNKGKLVNPTSCIGHGACKEACPVDAIELVFGTEKRGVDIPLIDPLFETTVPGIYIAGELGGMGLIGNAIEQGRQAMDSIVEKFGAANQDCYDVIIIGCGPSGFSASLRAMEKGLKFLTFEQDTFGGTVANFPRGKIVMTRPVDIPIIGEVKLRETTKEALMELWEGIRKKTGLEIQENERMENIEESPQGYQVKTTKGVYETRSVLLTIGRRGTPRKLGVTGEEHTKVVYRLIDPAQYANMSVLVVGGGDSALEAAVTISEEPGTTVTISYRSEAFGRAKKKNREKIQAAVDGGTLQTLMKSNVKEITADKVMLDHDGTAVEIDNDAIIVCAGGILPTPFLKSIGITVETKFGTT